MTKEHIQEVLEDCNYLNYAFHLGEKNGVLYLQGHYEDADIHTGEIKMQHTRKWMLSEHMTESELVQTAFKMCLTSAEHRCREAFLYVGERVMGPHFNIQALLEISRHRRLAYRPPPKESDPNVSTH